MTDQSIEQEIQAKGLTAPRVTPKDIEDNMGAIYWINANDAAIAAGGPSHDSLAVLTICVIVTRSGFTVTGESACASLENFDADVGKKVAFENAKQKLWPLMGYALKERLFQSAQSPT